MSEIKRKRLRMEILDGMEDYLLRSIKSLEEENEYSRQQTDDDGNLAEWRQDDIRKNEAKIAEIKDIIKALGKM